MPNVVIKRRTRPATTRSNFVIRAEQAARIVAQVDLDGTFNQSQLVRELIDIGFEHLSESRRRRVTVTP